MKKNLSLLLAFLMLITVVGCGGNAVGNQDGALEGDTTKPITRGVFDGDVYKNETMGFRFAKPDSWVYTTDEEIAAAMNIASEVMNQDFAKVVENGTSVYDMMVYDLYTRTNIQIGYENLKKSLATNITEKQYLESVKKQIADIPNYKMTFSDKTETVKLGECEFTKMVGVVTTGGVTMTQAFYVHKLDGYMGFLTVTIRDGYTVAEVEALFS